MKKITLAILFIGMAYNICIAQTSLSIKLENGYYSNTGVQIPINGSINIPYNGTSRVNFTLNLVKPNAQATTGNFNLYLKKTASSPPMQISSGAYFPGNSNYFSTSFDVTLYDYYFNQSGGIVYAQYESTSGIVYSSNSYPVVINYPAIASNSINSNQSIIEGQTPNTLSGSNPSGGSVSYTYQWQISANNSSWNNIAGVTSGNYSPTVLNATTYYRRIVNSQYVSQSISNVVTVAVGAIVNTISPSSQTVCSGIQPQIITGNTVPNAAYQWQFQPAGQYGYEDVSGATNKDYQAPTYTDLNYFFSYRRVAALGGVSKYSNAVVISYRNRITNNTIGIQYWPGQAYVIKGTIAECGTGTYTYQWQRKINNVWTDETTTSATYFGPIYNGIYRRVVYSGSEVSYSNELTFTYGQ